MNKNVPDREVWAAMAVHWARHEVQKHLEEVQIHAPFTMALEKWLPGSKNMVVLEPGCGTGLLSAFVARRWGARVVCLDFILGTLKLAESNFGKDELKGDYVQADVRHLPFKEGVFDLVFNQGVIEHFDVPDRQQVVGEMVRVSRKHVAVFVPNSLNPLRAVAKRVQAWLGRWRVGLELPYSPWELDRRLRKAGLTITKRGGVNLFKNFYTYWPFRLVEPWLRWTFGKRLVALNVGDGFLSRVFADELFALGTKTEIRGEVKTHHQATTEHREG